MRTVTIAIFLMALFLCYLAKGMIGLSWSWTEELFYYALSVIFSLLLSFSIYTYVTLIKTRGYSMKNLVKNLKEKVWMTFGLGISFVGLFFLINFFGHYMFKTKSFIYYLEYGLRHPALFFKGACLFLVANALLVYVIRMVVKFLYVKNSRKSL